VPERAALALLAISVAAAIALFVFLVNEAIDSAARWEAFAAQHECKVVGKVSGSTSVGHDITASGKFGTVITSTPGKTGYLCNDGVTYWR
jgi:hypothetical protein